MGMCATTLTKVLQEQEVSVICKLVGVDIGRLYLQLKWSPLTWGRRLCSRHSSAAYIYLLLLDAWQPIYFEVERWSLLMLTLDHQFLCTTWKSCRSLKWWWGILLYDMQQNLQGGYVLYHFNMFFLVTKVVRVHKYTMSGPLEYQSVTWYRLGS